MQTSKHTVGSPRMNVAPTPSAKTKAKSKGKTVEGLIDPAKAKAAAKVVAGSDGGKAKPKASPAKASPAKKSKAAKPKAAKAKPATPTRPGLRDPFPGSLTAKMVSLLQRPNGATITEIMRTRPGLKGATPGATISAEISRLKPFWKIERLGDGKGDQRRFRITRGK